MRNELEPLAAPPGLLALSSPRILRPGAQAVSQRPARVCVTLKRGAMLSERLCRELQPRAHAPWLSTSLQACLPRAAEWGRSFLRLGESAAPTRPGGVSPIANPSPTCQSPADPGSPKGGLEQHLAGTPAPKWGTGAGLRSFALPRL